MPRARKRAASPEEVVEVEVEERADEVMQEPGNALQFDEPLTWRAGKPIPVSDLLRRFKTLYEELQPMDQAEADRETLVPKAQELANVQLLGHKDKGVKAWALLCIVEMFRLLAPDAPYKSGQLKQIFELFVSTIVPALASPTDPYSQQHQLVLTSLTTVKSIVLLTDIPGSDALILNLFSNCFDVMSGNARGGHGETVGKNVEYHMTQMLSTLVDECHALPDGVIDIILAQFLRADPHTLSATSKKAADVDSFVVRELSPAYNMARSVCNVSANSMTRIMGQYFSNVLIDATESFSTAKPAKSRGKKRTHDESEDESDDGLLTPPAESDWREVEKAHRLLRELWRSSPDVIQNVIPLLDAEVAAETTQLRTMAVQTIGDMAAGIGAAGPPPPPDLDPAAYPSQSLVTEPVVINYDNPLLIPRAPHAFASIYSSAYQGFIDRRRDKQASVRSAWATAAGRIISTAGGGKGLDAEQETQLIRYLSDMLMDNDEKVRLAAVEAVASFDFNTVVQEVGSNGGVESPGSLLSNLCDRIKDRKHNVRIAAMELLGRIWGVAAGAIAEGSERIRELLGPIPTRIFMAFFVNDKELNALVQRVTFESLLPISYPPIKPKPAVNGDSQRVVDSQYVGDDPDPDAIRAERVLVLIRDLDEKAKKVFFALQQHQAGKGRYIERYLKACATVYGTTTAEDDDEVDEKADKKELDLMIDALSRLMPDSPLAAEHLKKFAKHHDRRSFHLIRLCYSADSDYRKIVKATKELTKRMEDAPSDVRAVLETLLPLLQSVSNLVNNRSHVPAIMHFARTDDKGLGSAAHEILTELSTNAPEIFKVHVHELCDGLRKQAPTATTLNQATAVEELKACAGFASRFAKDMPQDRDFYKAMTAFAKHGTPPEAAKHAVTIILRCADKREMYVKEILNYALTDFDFGAECFLSRLAALSQLRLVANVETEDSTDEIMAVAVTKILGQVRTVDDDDIPAWDAEIDDDLCAKLWAIKILVNGLRGMGSNTDSEETRHEINAAAPNVYRLLNTLIDKEGELSKTATTAKHHKAHLRLAAANQLLKLSCNRLIDPQLAPRDFNRLARIAQDPLPEVRGGFVRTLKKYLGQGKLPNRFYSMVFLYAFEPHKSTLDSTSTWLKARASLGAKNKDTAMESVFARFLSLLAHHQDFSAEPDDLADFVEYIMFYLKTVATEANLPLIYHLAQRVKTVQDGTDPEKSENLYIMSDLAEAVIRAFQDAHGWSLQIISSKARLPSGIFAAIPSRSLAQEVAEKRYVPEELADEIENLVKASMKTKKRKSDGSSKPAAKKQKSAQTRSGAEREKKLPVRKAAKTPKVAKTPKKKAVAVDSVPSSQVRKSARTSRVARNYVENEDSEDDEEMEAWDQEGEVDEDVDVDEEDEGKEVESTPPTSDPTPGPALAKEATPVSAAKSKPEPKKAAKPPAKGRPRKAIQSEAPPQRATRATRATKSKKEKDIMDVPSDDDEELSELPSEME